MSSKTWVQNYLWVVAWLCTSALYAGGPSFSENKGQWHGDVHYRAQLPGVHAFVDQQGLTLLLEENNFSSELHDHIQGIGERSHARFHAVKLRIEGMDLTNPPETRGQQAALENYFLGNDPSRWASDVASYKALTYHNALPGVDLRYDLKNGSLKYEFVVAPGTDPDAIKLRVDGADRMHIDDGDLVISTSVGPFRELAPFAFQVTAQGVIRTVPCKYRLRKNRVQYDFPEGYDPELPLVIDPELAFSTFIGSGSSSFGFTASYDTEGSLYAGAIVFGAEYPTTAGAFQVDFGGATVDCTISKFNSDGTELIYSTFLGGIQNEAPHSIVVSEAGEAYIMGTTSSMDFPTLAGSFQAAYGGGTNVATNVGFSFANGSDIFVTKLNPDGNALVGSTYVGGSGNDGISMNTEFNFNYGDLFRGEIVIDDAGNAYVASVTNSFNFPVVGGYGNAHTGNLSGVIFKLSPDLTSMVWSTYSGGNASESATALQLAADNSVYFSGGTYSTNIASVDAFQSTNQGGVDGYVGHISSDGSNLLHATFTGTSDFDLNYFIQIDTAGEVYVVGQSLGAYPVIGAVYQNAGSKQFIQKLSPDLTTGIWSTVVGAGSGEVDISLSAFLVADCGQIYLAGWGGSINQAGGSTDGLPITPDAFQPGTDGNDFYVMVLEPDAEGLVYGTYFGGGNSSEHVDGGTSRFDKDGTVYQAVCAGCGGNSDLPTQPGVWSQTNNSVNCNLAVFKMRLSSVQILVDVDAPDVICEGSVVNFINQTTDADLYLWDFGDGNTSTEESPSYTYGNPGTYEVKLYAESINSCLSPDSTTLTIEVVGEPVLTAEEPEPICPGDPLQLFVDGADEYQWTPASAVSDPTAADPEFIGTGSTTLTVLGTTPCGSQEITVQVTVGSDAMEVSDDVSICPGQSVQLSAAGAASYLWEPAESLNDPNIANPTASPAETTTYTVTGISADDCDAIETVTVVVLPPPPILQGDSVHVSCNGAAVQIAVSGANVYSWSPSEGLSNTTESTTTALPATTTTYTVTGANACGEDAMDITVLVNEIQVSLSTDSIVCHRTPFQVSASGGTAYIWQPAELFANHQAQQTTASIGQPTVIKVTGYDADGCFSTADQLVMLYPRPIITAGRDRIIRYGDEIEIESNSIFPIVWEPSPYLSCLHCNHPLVNTLETTTFYATITSDDGCVERDSVTVFVQGNLYVPNAFTPDGDGINDLFKAEGLDIVEFQMEVFNRWGELVFRTDDITQGWNGAMMGSDYYCPAGMYPYKIRAREAYGDLFEYAGHVHLLR